MKAPFKHIVTGYEKALFLGSFIDAATVAHTSNAEIAVCFADLRGFTKFVDALQTKSQDTRVHSFLRAYFGIYPKAILEMIYGLEPTESKTITAQRERVCSTLVPSMYKHLGDGMMLVWELTGDRATDDEVSGRILQTIKIVQRRFDKFIQAQVRSAVTPYRTAVGNLKLGFGLARGRAWRLDFGSRGPRDYAGNIVNLAARLQDLARPEGIVAEAGFCDPLFRKLSQRLNEVEVKGMDDKIEVWTSPEVVVTGLPNMSTTVQRAKFRA